MKVVFWDWNGTLVNDAAVLCDVFNALIEARGYAPISMDRYREIYRHPVQGMYEDAGVDLSKHDFAEIAHSWHEEYTARVGTISLHHDALTALNALKTRGSRQMVLSALPQSILVESVKQHGVGHFFEHVRGLAHLRGDSKVAEAVNLVGSLGIAGSEITIIGDSSHDAEVARELSAQCFLVARGAESRAKLALHGFPVVDSFHTIIGNVLESAQS